jgi:hypothetical protein
MLFFDFPEFLAITTFYHFETLRNKKNFINFLKLFIDIVFAFVFYSPFREIRNILFCPTDDQIKLYSVLIPFILWVFYLQFKAFYFCWKNPRILSLYLFLVILYIKTEHPYLKHFNIHI